MDQRYIEWVAQNIPKDCLNRCDEFTHQMAEAFPELKCVRGTVFLSSGYERPHWWLVTENNEIVDPTASQFSSDYYGEHTRIFEYYPIDEATFVEPTGKCPNCADGLCYNGDTCCSDKCGREYAAYLMREI